MYTDLQASRQTGRQTEIQIDRQASRQKGDIIQYAGIGFLHNYRPTCTYIVLHNTYIVPLIAPINVNIYRHVDGVEHTDDTRAFMHYNYERDTQISRG